MEHGAKIPRHVFRVVRRVKVGKGIRGESMGKVMRVEDLLKKKGSKRLPPHIEKGIMDLDPNMREQVREIIACRLKEFEDLEFKEIMKRIKEESKA